MLCYFQNETSWDKFTSISTLFKDLPSVAFRKRIPMLDEGDVSSVITSKLEDQHSSIGIWNPTISSIITGKKFVLRNLIYHYKCIVANILRHSVLICPVGALCVQYQNEDIWHLLQTRIQQLQLSQAESQLCDILRCNSLLFHPEFDYQAASLFLKAATALIRLSTLHLPALVQTYRDV